MILFIRLLMYHEVNMIVYLRNSLHDIVYPPLDLPRSEYDCLFKEFSS
jgi:hypothetical protein